MEVVSTAKRTCFDALNAKPSAGSLACARRKISRAGIFSSSKSAASISGDAVIDGTSGSFGLVDVALSIRVVPRALTSSRVRSQRASASNDGM